MRHFSVPDRVLNVLMPEVVLQGPGVVAIVGELEPTGVAKHVRVDREWHLGGLPEAQDKPVEADGTDGPAGLGNEYVIPDCGDTDSSAAGALFGLGLSVGTCLHEVCAPAAAGMPAVPAADPAAAG